MPSERVKSVIMKVIEYGYRGPIPNVTHRWRHFGEFWFVLAHVVELSPTIVCLSLSFSEASLPHTQTTHTYNTYFTLWADRLLQRYVVHQRDLMYFAVDVFLGNDSPAANKARLHRPNIWIFCFILGISLCLGRSFLVFVSFPNTFPF